MSAPYRNDGFGRFAGVPPKGRPWARATASERKLSSALMPAARWQLRSGPSGGRVTSRGQGRSARGRAIGHDVEMNPYKRRTLRHMLIFAGRPLSSVVVHKYEF